MARKRIGFTLIGNVLIAVSLGGLVMLTCGPPDAWIEAASDVAASVGIPSAATAETRAASDSPSAGAVLVPDPIVGTTTATPRIGGSSLAAQPVAHWASTLEMAISPAEPTLVLTPPALGSAEKTVPFRPITGVAMPSISLQAEVVPAKLVPTDGGLTWEVPAFKAGHAEASAGAGETGNAVLFGHVVSKHLGNVFKDLDKIRVGDRVQVLSERQEFDYEVVDVREVDRTDVSVVQPTAKPSISLITCTGLWLPPVRDFAKRLVVRAELINAESAATLQPPASAPQSGPLMAARRSLLDEHFADNRYRWPDDPRGPAWLADGVYHLSAKQPNRFIAIGAPVPSSLSDVVVAASFRKVGGPPGGGYGLILRDQGPGPRDGINQGGRFYVLEAGDRGEFGIWRREGDRWVDLVPWTRSEAVRPGDAANELTVHTSGQRLTFFVNGQQIASQVDAALTEGTVGVFVGGDFNEAVLERFVVAVPN